MTGNSKHGDFYDYLKIVFLHGFQSAIIVKGLGHICSCFSLIIIVNNTQMCLGYKGHKARYPFETNHAEIKCLFN